MQNSNQPLQRIFIFCFILFLMPFQQVFAQTLTDTYQIEEKGYFCQPHAVYNGIVFTDNLASKIYYWANGERTELVATPACGMYFGISKDKHSIGFKYISENGEQTPAIIDIKSKKITQLHKPSKLSSQVFFDDDNRIYYAVEKKLYKTDVNNKPLDSVLLPYYSNINMPSPDGSMIIYSNDEQQLFIYNWNTHKHYNLTDNKQAYIKPIWSPDGKYVLFTDFAAQLYLYSVETGFIENISIGLSPSWSFDSKFIVYHRSDVGDFQFHGSELYLFDIKNKEETALTNTPLLHECQASFSSANTIICYAYGSRQILEYTLDWLHKSILSKKVIYEYSDAVPLKYYHQYPFQQQAKATINFDVPYVHQKYDTPDWHNGSGSCAPTTSIMALAYYNVLPKWTINCSSPYAHTSDYGNYVPSKYNHNEISYVDYASAYGTDAWGGYGYMWTGSYTPNSRMATYLSNHGLVSTPQYWTTSCTWARTMTELTDGYPQPLCNYLTSSGHLVLCVGVMDGIYTVICNDPYGNKNTPGYPSYDGKNARYDWPTYNNGYVNLDASGTHGYIAWTVRSRGAEPVYNDTIVDDIFYQRGFYMHNQPPSHMRYYRDKKTGGYNGHFWYTYTSASTTIDTCFVRWTPKIPSTGNYEVFAFIPSHTINTTAARYKIYHQGGSTLKIINQSANLGNWVSLGIYSFVQGTSGYVQLGDGAGVAGKIIGFDAVKFVKTGLSVAVNTINATCFGENDGMAIVHATNGTPPYQYTWSTNPVQHGDTALSLAAGLYFVTVSDANNQSAVSSFTIQQPAAIVANFIVSHPSIHNGSDGSISATVVGGTPPYNYAWSTIPVSYQNNISNLFAGIYYLTITDSKGCIKIDSVELINPPFCSNPTGLLANEITWTMAKLQWNACSNAHKYVIKYKRAADSQWNTLTNEYNFHYLTGLAANTNYQFQVACICGLDTSDFVGSTFATTSLTSQTCTLCRGIFTDSGGEQGNYGNNENYTFTVLPPLANKILVEFEHFVVEKRYDTLFIHDGANTSAALIGKFDTIGPGVFLTTTGSVTFRFKSDASTVKSGWKARWQCFYAGEPKKPSSVIDSTLATTWQTDTFNLFIADIDSNYIGWKNRFYHVSQLANNHWVSNSNNGFFTDNFESNIPENWNQVSGTWSINNENLFFTDETTTNSNIYTNITQSADASYLYSFKMLIDGSGSNKRAGIYIFADNPLLTQRGNAYLIWFREDDDLVQLYRVTNNNIVLLNSVRCIIQKNAWHQYLISYQPNNGQLIAYCDGKPVAAYTDTNPLQSGTAISLRTANAIARFDDFQVFKSRIDSVLVSIGETTNNDISQQNENSSTPAAKIKATAIDNNYNIALVDDISVNIDFSAPENIAWINDGLSADIDIIHNNNALSFNWAASNDINSGIKAYWIAIDTVPGGENILNWTSIGNQTSFTATGLYLENGKHYYASVKAENYAGLFSNITSSNGQQVCLLPVLLVNTSSTNICAGDSIVFINNSENTFNFNWTFTGGNITSSTATNPIVFYPTAGQYTATLIGQGMCGVDTLNINDIEVFSNPQANFNINNNIIDVNGIILFTNQSQNANRYYWNFGDGSVSNDVNPWHQYTQAGFYTITLVAMNDNCPNDTLVFENLIHVIDPTNLANSFPSNKYIDFININKDCIDIVLKNLNSGSINIQLLDVHGKLIEEMICNTSSILNKTIKFDIAHLSNGMYMLKIQHNEFTHSLKIVKI